MQYILTEEEYHLLKDKADKAKKLPDKDSLQKLCTLAANHAPSDWKGDDSGKPWGCILSNTTEYCDGCPAQKVCPYEWKEWSK